MKSFVVVLPKICTEKSETLKNQQITATATFLTLLGVAVIRASDTDQSALTIPENEPIESLENHEGEKRIETPQVVVQLKYDNGELNKIYLAQFRKSNRNSWSPSVPARTNLCADLCHAGLGGRACGSSCSDMLPVGLQGYLDSSEGISAALGEPRVAVCPTLCHNQLGRPLCNCSAGYEESLPQANAFVDWSGVCDAFCHNDGYVLGGCPRCPETTTIAPLAVVPSRVLNTEDGWVAWCSVQCQQGHGGAACNCNRSPLQ